MIAVVGLPGSAVVHAYVRVASRREGEAWISATCKRLADRHPARGAECTALLSDRESQTARYRDGTRVYPWARAHGALHWQGDTLPDADDGGVS